MITIDGSQGEGGGQIVRSSLALAMITGQPLTIMQVRKNRRPPGLKQQHLTAVRAAVEVCGAKVEGADIGSSRLVFEPAAVTPGNYSFNIGTAGSGSLVLQTILPALLCCDLPSRVSIIGGTHNMLAPPFDFLDRAYLPLVTRMGPQLTARLIRPGFYPAGGGEFQVEITPAPLGRLELVDRGRLKNRRVRALVSQLPRHIGERECRTIARKSGWPESCFSTEEIDQPRGPGNVVMIEVEFEHVTEVFTGFGKRGLTAEKVAASVWREANKYLGRDHPVGEHLADQLLLPLGIGAAHGQGGGSFRTSKLSLHAQTHIEVLRTFLDLEVAVEDNDTSDVIVRVERSED